MYYTHNPIKAICNFDLMFSEYLAAHKVLVASEKMFFVVVVFLFFFCCFFFLGGGGGCRKRYR